MATYDCIVVGAGSAGAVVASRLTEDPGRSVLLLEAGPDWRPDDTPPVLRGFNFFEVVGDGRFVWDGLQARMTPTQEPGPYFVGHGLGGGSTANGVVWVRPPLEDFDTWASLGCAGWSGEAVLPYFKRAEADELGHRDYHGADGPVPVWRPPESDWGAVDRALAGAAADLGHPRSPDLDFNAPGSTGISAAPYNSRDGVRVSTNHAYVEPARGRENLTLETGALVDRVRFDGDRATGVAAVVDGRRRTFEGDRVVLSAGAIHTPAILQRSGIGPEAVLADVGADLRVSHDAVGRLLDHPLLTIPFDLAPDHRTDSTDDPAGSVFVRWDSGSDAGWGNDLYLMAQNVNRIAPEPLAEGALLLGLTQVYSTGRVRVATADPTDLPEVRVGMFADRRDRERMREGLRHAVELLENEAFEPVRAGEPRAGSSVERGRAIDTADDAALDALMLEGAKNYSHPVGTARMGDPSDPDTVVGPDGAVVGVRDLYVADASIMPTIVRCNTNATAVMIGERLADAFRGAF